MRKSYNYLNSIWANMVNRFVGFIPLLPITFALMILLSFTHFIVAFTKLIFDLIFYHWTFLKKKT